MARLDGPTGVGGQRVQDVRLQSDGVNAGNAGSDNVSVIRGGGGSKHKCNGLYQQD